MDNADPKTKPESEPSSPQEAGDKPEEIGNKDRPEPTRYGDWEINGRCIDF